MKEKRVVVTSRKWHQPQVEAFVTLDAVGAQVDLTDFIEAVIHEVGNPTLLVTKKQLHDKVSAAIEEVLSEMKSHTAKVVV